MRDILDFILKILPAAYMMMPWLAASVFSMIAVHVIRLNNRFMMRDEYSPLTLFMIIAAVSIPLGMICKLGMAQFIAFLVPDSPELTFDAMVFTGVCTIFGSWIVHKGLVLWGEKHNPKFALSLKVKHYPPYKSRLMSASPDKDENSYQYMDDTEFHIKTSEEGQEQ
jgi:hypothetical protein